MAHSQITVMKKEDIFKGVSRFFMAVALLLVAAPIAGAANNALINRADSAYLADDYSMAASLYLQAEKECGTSSALLYNIGNSYYRLGDIGKAILYYKRSLQLDPTNNDARQNIQFAMTKTVDKQDDNRSVMRKTADRILFSNSPNGWAMWALGIFVLLMGAAAMYVFSDSVVLRKICFFGGIVAIVLDGVLVYVACKSASIVSDENNPLRGLVSPNGGLSLAPAWSLE